MIKTKIRVLIVEDSILYQTYLRRIVQSDACLEVVGTAGTGRDALAQIPLLEPDVITLDLHLPDTDGLSLLQTLVRSWNIPVIVVTSTPDACEDAIRLGARDFIEKIPDARAHSAEQFALLLKLKVKMQATGHFSPDASPVRTQLPHHVPGVPDARQRLIVIGASLGGTEATLEILRQLPDTLPGIVVVQHMPAGFTNAYAMRLDQYCSMAVREARNGDAVLPGTVLIARGGQQLTVHRAARGFRVRSVSAPSVGGFCPSVDVLFGSAAENAGNRAVGGILTGMGHDGAAGMKQMHNAGAYTMGQEKDSCAVFGMPAAASAAGGVDVLLTPGEIAQTLIRQFR
ncbi:MAG: chemotaxis-specific protein-glutamate methyltransferase CheB [Oscillospiraceae bacterium]|nr:chemotaxis-specific protein-glutamate methyltransferase CheB [Oscillospiraceae bacterium]